MKTDLSWLEEVCAQANSFTELAEVALEELYKFPGGAEVVCGPITTGGRGNVKENLRVFFATVEHLQRMGRPIFSQAPYEKKLFLLHERWHEEDSSRAGMYCMPILEEFYLRLFQTRQITRGWFIPGWESSFGATWEHDTLLRNEAEVCYLAPEQIDAALAPV